MFCRGSTDASLETDTDQWPHRRTRSPLRPLAPTSCKRRCEEIKRRPWPQAEQREQSQKNGSAEGQGLLNAQIPRSSRFCSCCRSNGARTQQKAGPRSSRQCAPPPYHPGLSEQDKAQCQRPRVREMCFCVHKTKTFHYREVAIIVAAQAMNANRRICLAKQRQRFASACMLLPLQ